jgi:hypothetical protein
MEADAQQILRTSTINSSALCKGPGGLTPDLLTLSLHAVLLDPFGDLAGKFHSLVDLTVAQFGILAPLIPIGFIASCVRRPAYAFLTGVAPRIAVGGTYDPWTTAIPGSEIGWVVMGPLQTHFPTGAPAATGAHIRAVMGPLRRLTFRSSRAGLAPHVHVEPRPFGAPQRRRFPFGTSHP